MIPFRRCCGSSGIDGKVIDWGIQTGAGSDGSVEGGDCMVRLRGEKLGGGRYIRRNIGVRSAVEGRGFDWISGSWRTWCERSLGEVVCIGVEAMGFLGAGERWFG